MKAIDNFNPELDVRFSTYGVPMIVGEIRRFLRDNNAIRVSRSMRDIGLSGDAGKGKLYPRVWQGTDHRGDCQKARVQKRRGRTGAGIGGSDPVSLYEPVYSDGGDTIFVMDQVGDSNDDRDWLEEISLRDAIRSLGREGKENSDLALSGRKDPDRSGTGDRHFSGTGVTFGKECAGTDQRSDAGGLTAAFEGDMIQKNIGEATKRMDNQNHAMINNIIVERAHPEDAAELLEFTKTMGAQTDNLTYGAEGVGASVEQEADFLKGLYDSQKEIFLVAKADGKIVGHRQTLQPLKSRGYLTAGKSEHRWKNPCGDRELQVC